MNTKKGFGLIGIIIVIAIAAIVGGGAYYATHRGPAASTDTDVQATTTADGTVAGSQTGVAASAKTSLKELLALGRNLSCTFTSADVKGTVFIAGREMRGDFTMAGGDSHMIRTGDTVYVWTSTSPNQGFKMNVTQEQKALAQATTSAKAQAAVGLDDKIAYNCAGWNPDSTKFAPPSTIKFTDMSTLLQVNATTSASVKASQCAVCDAIGDAGAKAQCKQSLACK